MIDCSKKSFAYHLDLNIKIGLNIFHLYYLISEKILQNLNSI